jgi:cell division protein FtsW
VAAKQVSPQQRVRVRSSDRPDPWIVALTLLFVAIGAMFVLDTTYFFSQRAYGDGYRMAAKHAISIVLGGVLMIVLSRCRSDLLERVAKPGLVVAALLLLAPLVPGIGTCTKGACRWVTIGPLNLQPAEIAKGAVVLYLASMLAAKGRDVRNWRQGLVPTLAVIGVLAVIMLKQPDFGSVVVIGGIGMVMMFLAGVPIWQLGLVCVPAVAGAGLLVMLEPYRVKRLLCFLNPLEDPSGACYQVIQSSMTFGSGRIGGVGLGNSVQKTGYLPEAHTDFIFSVIGEEMGLIGAMVVLLCFCMLAYRGFRVAHRHPDLFGQLLAAGLTFAIISQALINMGVVLGLLPTKGLVLPFFSYGGSSMLMSLACIGILMSLSRELRER